MAGLTAALELLRLNLALPVVIESNTTPGGIVRPFPHGTGFVDVGGHRFHSQSDRVRDWWFSVMPLGTDGFIQKKRISFLRFEGKTYPYPLELGLETFAALGLKRSWNSLISYINRPKLKIRSMEDYFHITYGKVLSRLFFESYTQKVWGHHAHELAPDWGPERLKTPHRWIKKSDTFFYPTGGPAVFWQKVADEISDRGGKILTETIVTGLGVDGNRIDEIRTTKGNFTCQKVLSTLPLTTLNQLLNGTTLSPLKYRALISVNLSFSSLEVNLPKTNSPQWIYFHEPNLKMSRLQNYRAWDETMLGNEEEILGLEYFCHPGDELWKMSDEDYAELALNELKNTGLIAASAKWSCATVHRLPNAYPCHLRDNEAIAEHFRKVDQIENLISFGRQGLHRYLNMDLTMLSALEAIDKLKNPQADYSLRPDFQGLHAPE